MNATKTLILSAIFSLTSLTVVKGQSDASETNDLSETYSADRTENMMKGAHDYSKTGEGIGIYMLAGTNYEGVGDDRINQMFNNSTSKHGVKVKVFVERTDKRKFSIFKVYVNGEGVGIQANIEDFSKYLREAIIIFKKSKALPCRGLKP